MPFSFFEGWPIFDKENSIDYLSSGIFPCHWFDIGDRKDEIDREEYRAMLRVL
jgi:hypothetical protein